MLFANSVPALGAALLRFALPPRCPGCGAVVEEDHLFCVACWRSLEFLGAPECARCGEPFAHDLGAAALCGACLADPPALDGVAAAVAYGDIARTLALKLKHGGRPGVARTIAAAMARRLPAGGEWLMVPVPLHRWRIWRRGYNQAALIARALARAHPAPLALDLIERHKATPMLRGMNPAERRRIVTAAFAVQPARRAGIKGRRILLVDDIYTTGATANACARVLKRAGAAEVRLICWARVVREDGIER